ncbi:MAG: DUF1624 domain-containing protein [Candidatus Lokiarchaeota archaeon]|nr:DUF1624 domain-containing protein [Candidatus Lokiarchaeota archaeon]
MYPLNMTELICSLLERDDNISVNCKEMQIMSNQERILTDAVASSRADVDLTLVEKFTIAQHLRFPSLNVKKRIKSVDWIKGFAIMWVVFNHLLKYWLNSEDRWLQAFILMVTEFVGPSVFMYFAGVNITTSYRRTQKRTKFKDFYAATIRKMLALLLISTLTNLSESLFVGGEPSAIFLNFRSYYRYTVLHAIALGVILIVPFLNANVIIRAGLGIFMLATQSSFNSYFQLIRSESVFGEVVAVFFGVSDYVPLYSYFSYTLLGSAVMDLLLFHKSRIFQYYESQSVHPQSIESLSVDPQSIESQSTESNYNKQDKNKDLQYLKIRSNIIFGFFSPLIDKIHAKKMKHATSTTNAKYRLRLLSPAFFVLLLSLLGLIAVVYIGWYPKYGTSLGLIADNPLLASIFPYRPGFLIKHHNLNYAYRFFLITTLFCLLFFYFDIYKAKKASKKRRLFFLNRLWCWMGRISLSFYSYTSIGYLIDISTDAYLIWVYLIIALGIQCLFFYFLIQYVVGGGLMEWVILFLSFNWNKEYSMKQIREFLPDKLRQDNKMEGTAK